MNVFSSIAVVTYMETCFTFKYTYKYVTHMHSY